MRANATSLVLVDFDDTLVDTAPRFQNARRDLFLMLEQAGFDQGEVRRIHHEEIDPAMRTQYGLGPSRMEPAFRATYEALCVSAGLAFDCEIADRAGGLGRCVAGTPPVLAGALAALRRLASALPTALYTQAGDRDYQLRCVDEAGVLAVLAHDRVCICECKTTGQFLRTLTDFGVEDPGNAWMIGNSMRSDINPALEAGANAILVDVADPWEFDLVEPVSNTFYRAASFEAAVDLLLEMTA